MEHGVDARQWPTLARPAAPLAACVQRQQKLFAMATSLEGSKNSFQIDHIYSHSSTNPEDLAKIGPVLKIPIHVLHPLLPPPSVIHGDMVYDPEYTTGLYQREAQTLWTVTSSSE